MRRIGVVLAGLAIAVASISVLAQAPSSEKTSFEVASVKLYKTSGPLPGANGCNGTDSKFPVGMRFAPPPLGRCVLRGLSLKRLVAYAYRGKVLTQYIIGGPSWTDTDQFEIEAKAPEGPPPTEEQIMQMLRNLLADRFRLRFHWETRDVSGYLLRVTKDGQKMKESGNGESHSGILMNLDKAVAQNVSMDQWASFLSSRLAKPVVDNTGLTERFTFTMSLADLQLPESASESDEVASIFTALPEQLGLRLESQKVPVAAFIIDAADKLKCE